MQGLPGCRSRRSHFSKYIGKGGVVRMKHVCNAKRILEIYQHNNSVDQSLQFKKLEGLKCIKH